MANKPPVYSSKKEYKAESPKGSQAAQDKKVRERRAANRKAAAERKSARKAKKAAKKVAKQKAKNVKKISKMAIKAEKKEKGAGLKSVTRGKGSRPEKLSPTGKIRRGAKGVEVTEGGAYAKYGKKSKAAKSFRSAFSDASKEGKGTFEWDGRSYTTKKAQFGGRVVGAGMPIPSVAPPLRPRYKKGGKVKANNPYGWPTKDTGNGGK